jgi:Delta7-sterol 5-desaturase
MTTATVVYAAILALINFPFVMAIDWITVRRPVKRVYDVPEKDGQRSRETKNSIVTTPVHAILFVAFISSGFLRLGDESLGLAVGSFLLAFMWTEVWHYASHVAMHAKPLHFIHREHHLSRLTEPWTSVSFSLFEKFIFSFGILGMLAVISQFHPLSAFGIFAYYTLYFFTNTLGHANFEFRKEGYYKSFMGKVFNSPSYHALHHARYIKNFGLLTPWLDRVFGTEWEDVEQVQSRAASGHPLRSLSERCLSKHQGAKTG